MPNGKFTISISDRLLQDDTSVDGLKNTIIHELLHTAPGCMNHGKQWKMYAEKVNQAYGYNIKRTSSASEKGVEENIRIKKINHKFVCTGCGQIITRERESKFTREYQRYSCGRCGGNFRKEF